MVDVARTVALACTLGLFGCDGSTSEPLDAGVPDAGLPDAATSDQPLYLVSGFIVAPEGGSAILSLVPSLDESTTPDIDESVALDQFAVALATDGEGAVFVGLSESPEIVRWRVEPDGTLSRGDRFSLAAVGLPDAAVGKVVLISPTKAYWVSVLQGQVVVWNPQTMTIGGDFSLELARRGRFFPVTAAENMVLREDGTLLIPTFYGDALGAAFSDAVTLTVVDTATDSIVSSDDDDRCGASWYMQEASDGTVYVSGHVPHEVVRNAIPSAGAEVCQLRVLPSGTEVDDTYFVDLSTLTGGRPTGDFLLIDDETAGVLAFHEEDATPFAGDVVAYAFQNAYRWYLWRLDEPEATLVQTGEASSVAGRRFFIDGVWHFQEEDVADVESNNPSTLLTLTADGSLVRGLTFPGQIRNVLRVR